MGQFLKVSFDTPENGWLAISLSAGNQQLELPFSYTPFDFLTELVSCLLDVSAGVGGVARCSYNPEQYEFRFGTQAGQVQLEIISFPDRRRGISPSQILFCLEGPVAEICLAFWRGLRELQGRISSTRYFEQFRRQFPEKEMEQFTEKIRLMKEQKPK